MTHSRLLGATRVGRASEPPRLQLPWARVGLAGLWSPGAPWQSHSLPIASSPAPAACMRHLEKNHSTIYNMKLSPCVFSSQVPEIFPINLNGKHLPKKAPVKAAQWGLCFCSVGSGRQICSVAPGQFAVEGKGTPLQYSCREESHGRRAQWAAVHGIPKGNPDMTEAT